MHDTEKISYYWLLSDNKIVADKYANQKCKQTQHLHTPHTAAWQYVPFKMVCEPPTNTDVQPLSSNCCTWLEPHCLDIFNMEY